jgi:sec-independent protein translocase protein TatA
MNLGPAELVIILLIVVLLLGPGRIARSAGDLGKGIREFRKGLKDEPDDTAPPPPPSSGDSSSS